MSLCRVFTILFRLWHVWRDGNVWRKCHGYEANNIDYAIQDSAKDIADALIVSSSSTNLDSAISVATGGTITMQEASCSQSSVIPIILAIM